MKAPKTRQTIELFSNKRELKKKEKTKHKEVPRLKIVSWRWLLLLLLMRQVQHHQPHEQEIHH